MRKTHAIGDKIITHLGYGFLAESRLTAEGWHTTRSDGPYMSAFTDAERKAALSESKERTGE